MNKIFIFSDDDFREVEETSIKAMQTGKLIESLQGTLIGLHTIKNVTDGIGKVNAEPGVQFKSSNSDISQRLASGLASILFELEPRLGKEGVERIIAQTQFMIQFEKDEHDEK